MVREAAKTALLVIFIACSLVADGQNGSSAVTGVILKGYSAKVFSNDRVSDRDIEEILRCGIKAPSARNLQPWKFTVLKDTSLIRMIVPSATPGNILIVVSGTGNGAGVDFDCGLATQNMYIAAQSLGLGVHIYGSPVGNINSSMKQALGIPDDYRAVTVLRVGNINKNVDAVTSASTRKEAGDLVIYK